jgi:hypothetical protein
MFAVETCIVPYRPLRQENWCIGAMFFGEVNEPSLKLAISCIADVMCTSFNW